MYILWISYITVHRYSNYNSKETLTQIFAISITHRTNIIMSRTIIMMVQTIKEDTGRRKCPTHAKTVNSNDINFVLAGIHGTSSTRMFWPPTRSPTLSLTPKSRYFTVQNSLTTKTNNLYMYYHAYSCSKIASRGKGTFLFSSQFLQNY